MSKATTTVFLQDQCYKHAWIRTTNASHIFERPERLRAVKLGLAAAIAHIELELLSPHVARSIPSTTADELTSALENMKIAVAVSDLPVNVVLSSASLDLLTSPAVKFVHGDIEGDVYLENLIKWAKESRERISNGESEIPVGFNQGDLYLCPESLDAIQGALGTTCEAVDVVFSRENPVNRAFVSIRPPGHHCGEDTPSGFCFVNNVAVGAAHAHLKHNAKRIVILDIDLHHGNGTQSIVWQINEETYRQTLEAEAGSPSATPGPSVYYGSIHDILSYPCEDGKPELVQAASVSIHDAHGQNIENVHLRPYTSDEEFWKLYSEKYVQILTRAEEFLERTGGPGDDVMIFMSTGMDACEHEHEGMSRHGRKVPASFYERFTKDTRTRLADKYAAGRLVSVLEGGYSDRALTSASCAHLAGLVTDNAKAEWWTLEKLIKIEGKASTLLKKKRSARPSNSAASDEPEPWLERTMSLFVTVFDVGMANIVIPKGTMVPSSSSRTLRERKKVPDSGTSTPIATSAASSPTKPSSKVGGKPVSSASQAGEQVGQKKLPRVILKLGPRPDDGQ
ncbi:Arginase/deacetylase [Flagelloscypha sp. PMI_526]|nr:Arginase/deacetylase [Flagelloscypha sp. PMI_526]